MKLNDAIWGVLLLFLSAALLVHIQAFPKIPGQQYGAALMPGSIGVGLAVCGVLLIFKGAAIRREGEHLHWILFAEWTRMPRKVLAFILTIGVNVFYVLADTILGFILTGTIYLATLFWIFGVRLRNAVPIALVMTLLIHYAFYKLLRVPLPWGLLQGFTW
jgi:putative tricarboxylic transport membrane protein